MVDSRDIIREDIEGYIQSCLTYGAISQNSVDIVSYETSIRGRGSLLYRDLKTNLEERARVDN